MLSEFFFFFTVYTQHNRLQRQGATKIPLVFYQVSYSINTNYYFAGDESAGA